jgi:hypothetical protein
MTAAQTCGDCLQIFEHLRPQLDGHKLQIINDTFETGKGQAGKNTVECPGSAISNVMSGHSCSGL